MALAPMATRAEVARRRSALTYTATERSFSQFVQRRMYELLRGERDELVLARRYWSGKRAVAFPMPPRTSRDGIRADVAETIVEGVLRFFDPFSPGGPISQRTAGDKLIEIQTFPTQYPHIVVERTDVFRTMTYDPIYAEWRALRLQNQRKSTLVNRALDVGNLALEIARFLPIG